MSEVRRAPAEIERTNALIEQVARTLQAPWGRWGLVITEDSAGSTAYVGVRADVVTAVRAMADEAGRPEIARAFEERLDTREQAATDLVVFVVCPTGWLLQWASGINISSRGGAA